jgi:DNA-binding NarL/FixJ family response regulator
MDSEAALTAVETTGPDLAIVDIELPGSDGVILIGKLLAKEPDLAILVFSAHEQPGLIDLVAECGARGFVGKSETTSAIVPAARAVLAGELRFPAGVRVGSGADDELKRLRSLTPREREILELFAGGMRADGVASEIGVQRATVYTHVRNAIHKLNVDSRTQAVAIATRYAFLEHEPETSGST